MKCFKKMKPLKYQIQKINVENYENFNIRKNIIYFKISNLGFLNHKIFVIEDLKTGFLKNSLKSNNSSCDSISLFIPSLPKKDKIDDFSIICILFSNLIENNTEKNDLKLFIFDNETCIEKSIAYDPNPVNDSFIEIKYLNFSKDSNIA